MFQFLYLDLFKNPSLLKENGILLEDIFKEYDIIRDKIIDGIDQTYLSGENYIIIDIEKTTCKSDLYYNSKICEKDNFMVFIYPLINKFKYLNKDYIESEYFIELELYYSMTFVDSNYNYFKWKINKIIIFKIIRVFIFFIISSICLIFLFFILVDFFLEIKYIPIVQILYMIKDFSFFELNDKDEIIQQKKKIVLQTNNKEMEEVINLFNYLVKIALLKINFEQNNNNEKITSIKEDDHINSLDDYMDLIVNINNKEIFIMISFIISNRHFKKGLYKLAENEFKELIKELNIYTDKLNEEKENDETNLKDTISRFSKISYLNE